MGRRKLNIEFVKKQFYNEKYIVLTDVFLDDGVRNSKQKLKYICPNGHFHTMTWSNWQKGRRCPSCVFDGKKLKIDFVKIDFEKYGYILLTKFYENAHQKLKYICPNGHEGEISWGHWQQRQRCSICAISKAARSRKKCFDVVKFSIENADYVLVTRRSDYVKAKAKLHLICPNGHDYFVSWDNWQQGNRCPKCSNNGKSRWEQCVQKFLGELYINYVSNDKKQLINPNTNCFLELDIWLPQLNKAIECNGIYWHTNDDRKLCDKIKQQLCQQQGIDLLVVTDKEWNDDIELCKSKIQNFLFSDRENIKGGIEL